MVIKGSQCCLWSFFFYVSAFSKFETWVSAGQLSYLRGRGRRWLRLPGLAPPWVWEPAVGRRWRGPRRRSERWPGPTYSPGPVAGEEKTVKVTDESGNQLLRYSLEWRWDTDVCAVCSGGAVGLLLQLDLLQLLFLHQGQLLQMLLVLFGCESWERREFVTHLENEDSYHHR